MTYHRKRESQLISRRLGCFISNWNTRFDLGGAASPNGCLVPSSGASGWPFGVGDLILFAEFVGNDSATIPTDAVPSGYNELATNTLLDANGRGCRMTLSFRVALSAGDFGGRLTGMALPATNAAQSYRTSMCRCFYMSRPINTVGYGTAVVSASANAVGPITLSGAPYPVNGYDYDALLQVLVGKADGNPADASFTLSPQKGTEYRTYPNLFTAAQEAGMGTGVQNVKIFTNWYTHGDAPANMALTVADLGAGQMVSGIQMIIR